MTKTYKYHFSIGALLHFKEKNTVPSDLKGKQAILVERKQRKVNQLWNETRYTIFIIEDSRYLTVTLPWLRDCTKVVANQHSK